MEGDLVDYHAIAREIWLLMFRAFRGGALCNDEQMESYLKAQKIAHDNIDLGMKIIAMDTPPPEKE